MSKPVRFGLTVKETICGAGLVFYRQTAPMELFAG
jgi:hypothetical protein